MRSTVGSRFGGYSPDYQARKLAPLSRRYVAVQTDARHGLVHAVVAESFGTIAKRLLQRQTVTTCCGIAIKPSWTFIARGERTPVTCAACFHRTRDENPEDARQDVA